jgi:hypothetical protein
LGDNKPRSTPKLLQSLEQIPVVDITCCASTVFALSRENRIYIWGSKASPFVILKDEETPLWYPYPKIFWENSVLKIVRIEGSESF